jgi:hypothetical protein
MKTDLIEERIETLQREVRLLTEFLATHRSDTHLLISFGFIFRCSAGPFHVQEFMIENLNSFGDTKLVERQNTALLLDEPVVWFNSPEQARDVVATLAFDFPTPLIHVFIRTPLAELSVRIKERLRQITSLLQIIQPKRN